MLREIQGRTTDFVVAADGTVLHGLALIYILRDLPSVKQFKIVQESLHRTAVQVVPAQGYGTEVEAMIRSGLKARLGAGVDVAIEVAAAIAAEKSGKFRYIVSHVPAVLQQQPVAPAEAADA